MIWLLGEYLISSIAVSQYLNDSSGCRVSALTILIRPCLPPSARCCPHRENAISLHMSPTSAVRVMVFCATLHTKIRVDRQQLAYLSGSVGWMARLYTSAMWPYTSTRGVSSTSQMSHRLVPATKTWLPGMQSRPRNMGGASFS